MQRVSHLRYIKRFHICSIPNYWPLISANALIEALIVRLRGPTIQSTQGHCRRKVIHFQLAD
jgi:hypothetical protein